jgi:hypothetical protein
VATWKVVVATLAAVGVVGAGVAVGLDLFSPDDTPAQPSTTTSPTATHYANPDATKACDTTRAADDASDYSSATLTKAVDPAYRSGIFEFAFAANMALDLAELAEAGKGTSMEFELNLGVMNAVTEMLTQCARRGY